MSTADQHNSTIRLEQAADRGMALLESAAAKVESWMEAWPQWDQLPAALAQAGRYGVLGDGKRLRPTLVLTACEACGGDPDTAMPAAAALEMVHCFSLVHDDLPALDDDALRRGRPTLHVHAGEAMAILAGDLLLTQAFQMLATASWPDSTRAQLVRMLADDTVQMVAGQVYDTLGGCPQELSPVDQLRLVHGCKTGALIRGAVLMGAVVADADPDHKAALQDWGEAIGLMFQIVDDLLDVEQSEAHIGKAVGKDAAKGRPNWPQVLGIEASRREVDRLLQVSAHAIEPLGRAGEGLSNLACTLAVRTR
ncbi:MAG: polyprenyl synthetase family protein [Phycisphaerales bacterium]|nr:polyprenyl synthetase family protein [Phycisphaerales bacterium]